MIQSVKPGASETCDVMGAVAPRAALACAGIEFARVREGSLPLLPCSLPPQRAGGCGASRAASASSLAVGQRFPKWSLLEVIQVELLGLDLPGELHLGAV